MRVLPVSPTRMELSRLKKQLQLSERGHKLLKDKQDELMRQFITIIKEMESLRLEVEKSYRDIREQMIISGAAFTEAEILASCVTNTQAITVSMQPKNQMGVIVPSMSFKSELFKNSDRLSLSPALHQTKRRMGELFPSFLQLAQLEKHTVILSAEIEKTRRRVNALEYMTIPQLKETIRFIKMRLEDSERDRITRLIKMQDYEFLQKH